MEGSVEWLSLVLPAWLATSQLSIRIGREELIIRQRYEAASIVNDILIAVWFIVGSIMFFSEAWTTAGTWSFLAGSIELLIRPLIRLGRQVHLRRIGTAHPPAAAHDF